MNERDPDFAQRMHFMGPPGYKPCTRPDWPHDGPCAHPPENPIPRCELDPPHPFEAPHTVPCPCGCGGTLRSDGRNKPDTLTFLLCDTCGCCYRAEDSES